MFWKHWMFYGGNSNGNLITFLCYYRNVFLNSGFETAPGIKDAEKLKTFIDKIKK